MTSILSGVVASGKTGHLSNPIVGSFDALATVTVDASGASSVTFTSIPQTYTHLQIRAIARNSQSGSTDHFALLQMGNGSVDTGSNYSTHYLFGDGASAGAGAVANGATIYASLSVDNGALANAFGAGVIEILDYTNTNKYKTVRALTGDDRNGAGAVSLSSGLWMNTAAVNTISFTVSAANWQQYTQFALYGVK